MGIIDKKSRVVDVLLTVEGRRQLASGKLRIEGVSFSDGGTFYRGTTGSGVLTSERVMLEAASMGADSITPEADDSGRLRPFSNDTESIVVGGQVVTYTYDGTTETSQYLSGSAFSSQIANILASSTANLDKHCILGTNDGVFDVSGFATDIDAITFRVTDTVPLRNDLQTGDVTVMDSLFADPRLANLQNFAFLPPVNKRTSSEKRGASGRKIAEYVPLGPVNIPDWSTIGDELATIAGNGCSKTLQFDPTSRTNRLQCQMYEIGYDTATKLDIIEYGLLQTGNVSMPTVHLFFLGKVLEDKMGSQVFLHLFTVVFHLCLLKLIANVLSRQFHCHSVVSY